MAAVNEAIATGDARALAAMLRTLALMAKPTVARVQGAAIGGGLGLVAACDIVIQFFDDPLLVLSLHISLELPILIHSDISFSLNVF